MSSALAGAPDPSDLRAERLGVPLRVFVTGATGFLGRRVTRQLLERGLEVHASYHRASPPRGSAASWHRLDCGSGDEVRTVLQTVRPELLVHLAWDVGPSYQDSAENWLWATRSLELAQEFARVEGRYIFMAGTCAEYDWSSMPLGEQSTCAPTTAYGSAKLSLFNQLQGLNSSVATVTWARLFFLYGSGERSGRVIPRIIRYVSSGRAIDWISPDLRRDYLHVDDAAAAMVHLIMGRAGGVVNVASGEAPSVREIARKVARVIGAGEPAMAPFRPPASAPIEIRADVAKLRRLGWLAPRTMDEALAELCREHPPEHRSS